MRNKLTILLKALSFLFSFRKPEPPQPMLPGFRMGMSLEEYRAKPDNVARTRKLFQTEEFQLIWEVLCSQVPRGFPLRGQALTGIQAASELSRINGYFDCLNVIASLAHHQQIPSKPVEADFGAEQNPEENS
jgi:hypothetical protein